MTINTFQAFSEGTIFVFLRYDSFTTITYQVNGVDYATSTIGNNNMCYTFWAIFYEFQGAVTPSDYTAVFDIGLATEVTVPNSAATGNPADTYWVVGCWDSYFDTFTVINQWSNDNNPNSWC